MTKKRYLIITISTLLAMVGTGALWVHLASRFEDGQSVLWVLVPGVLFSAAFVWLLITRLRNLLAHPERRLLEAILLALGLTLLVVTFGWVHHEIGLIDDSGVVPRPAEHFGDAIYFSIVTSTTLGSGDFLPTANGRPIAALQAILGYLILGILVSTGFQIIAPHTNPSQAAADSREGSDAEPENGR